jgi:site-specific DNA-methyltransferase (adenine-specific)
MKSETYNMDCMEYMRTLPDKAFDLAIVDPPYGGDDAIGLVDCKTKSKQATERTEYTQFENIEPDISYWNELFRVSKNQIIWGANFYTKINLHGGRLVWDKKGTAFGRAEEAYLSMTKSVNIFEFAWNGMIQQDMKNKESRIHPTQKPVALYKWLLAHYAHAGDRIIDTHLGSGSSRIAAYDMGFDFVGIELDKDYFEAEEKRYSDHVSQLDLIKPEEIQQLQFAVNK